MMKNKYRVFGLLGASGSGKDYILNYLVDNLPPDKVNKLVPLTSRPKRDNEENGIDYRFLKKDEMNAMAKNNQIVGISKFNDWYYGFDIYDFSHSKINLGIFNCQNAHQILFDPCFVANMIFIDASDEIRKQRMFAREKNINIKEVERRWKADKKDYYMELPEMFKQIILWNDSDNNNLSPQYYSSLYTTKEQLLDTIKKIGENW